jgi:hypothetical protein
MKGKWMIAILIVVLPLLLAACGIKVVVVGTPTPKPTAVPTATRTLPPPTATPELTSTPAPTSAPTLAPTPAPMVAPTLPANLPTPAPKVNLKEVGNRLWSQASFAFDVLTQGDTYFHAQGEYIQSPQAWHIRHISEAGGYLLEYAEIGNRKWGVIGDVPITCTDWEQATAPLTQSTCKVADGLKTLVVSVLAYFTDDQEAELSSGPAMIDGVACYEYTWRDSGDFLCRAHLAAETGIPVLFQNSSTSYRLSRFNDPDNAIAPPVSEMPEKLYLDDARMALNGLSSFRYVTDVEMGDKDGLTTYRVEGVYLQASQAWQANWKWKPEDAQAIVEFLSIGGEAWMDWTPTDGVKTWLPSVFFGEAESMLKDAGPFANWPGASALPPAVLQPGSARTIAGVECQEYTSSAKVQGDQGTIYDLQVRLCVTADHVIPLRLVSTAVSDDFRFVITRELSHLDDPANVVEKAE